MTKAYTLKSLKKEKRIIKELDTVVLSRDLPEHGLKRGDIGAVVHCYKEGEAFEVEFVTGQGKTVAVITLFSDAIQIPPFLISESHFV